ncbi:MAG: TRAP transporter substrate-binding protein DctP, partial [bacterium]|nr:TRAP transporter substrate-binding protein DctP [bacterium]
MKKITLLFALLLSQSVIAAPLEIKFANIAPEGSAWANIMEEMDQAIQTRSGNRLKFKFYWGGVMGDEPDMLRKLRINQIQAAGLTGFGLGQISPTVRVLELPMIFPDAAALDVAKGKILNQLKEEFRKKGFEFLGWADVGPIYIFSNKPIQSVEDMKGIKIWMWEGDPLAGAAFKALGVSPSPLAVTDVLTSLQTGLIDAFYGPPLGVSALQWHTRVKYVLDERFNYAIGGFVISSKTFQALSPDLRKIISEESEKYCQKLVERTREDNQKTFELLKKGGIQAVLLKPTEKEKLLK